FVLEDGKKLSEIDYSIPVEEHYEIQALEWYEGTAITEESKRCDSEYALDIGKEYTVKITITPKTGGYFTEDAVVVWTGDEKGVLSVESQTQEAITVVVQLTHLAIETIDLQIECPKAGCAPATTAVEQNGKVNVMSVAWSTNPSVFEVGKTYTMYMSIEPAKGYKFPEIADSQAYAQGITLNDETGVRVLSYGGAYDYMDIAYTFTVTEVLLYGDVDADQTITAADALEVLKSVVGKVTLTEEQLVLADTDGSGSADAVDALNILKKVVGKIQQFPVEQ
ncbi:MAG: dockerin type I repeat-containing protein, partial [Clostridia bacterium]|nr:dockerin type I repeat-containing protein [Clostridia bacterium]